MLTHREQQEQKKKRQKHWVFWVLHLGSATLSASQKQAAFFLEGHGPDGAPLLSGASHWLPEYLIVLHPAVGTLERRQLPDPPSQAVENSQTSSPTQARTLNIMLVPSLQGSRQSASISRPNERKPL